MSVRSIRADRYTWASAITGVGSVQIRSSEIPAAFQSSGEYVRTSLSRESETAAPQASLDQIAGRRRPIRLTMRMANELAWPERNKLARLTPAQPPPCMLHALPAPFQPDLTVIEEITTSGYTMCVAHWSRQWAGARCATVRIWAAGREDRKSVV